MLNGIFQCAHGLLELLLAIELNQPGGNRFKARVEDFSLVDRAGLELLVGRALASICSFGERP